MWLFYLHNFAHFITASVILNRNSINIIPMISRAAGKTPHATSEHVHQKWVTDDDNGEWKITVPRLQGRAPNALPPLPRYPRHRKWGETETRRAPANVPGPKELPRYNARSCRRRGQTRGHERADKGDWRARECRRKERNENKRTRNNAHK